MGRLPDSGNSGPLAMMGFLVGARREAPGHLSLGCCNGPAKAETTNVPDVEFQPDNSARLIGFGILRSVRSA
jgi:hypothetical protein